jgi:hypothetical protein
MKPDSQSNTILNDKIEEKSPLKKRKIIKLIELTCQIYNPGHETRTTH